MESSRPCPPARSASACRRYISDSQCASTRSSQETRFHSKASTSSVGKSPIIGPTHGEDSCSDRWACDYAPSIRIRCRKGSIGWLSSSQTGSEFHSLIRWPPTRGDCGHDSSPQDGEPGFSTERNCLSQTWTQRSRCPCSVRRGIQTILLDGLLGLVCAAGVWVARWSRNANSVHQLTEKLFSAKKVLNRRSRDPLAQSSEPMIRRRPAHAPDADGSWSTNTMQSIQTLGK